MADFAMYGPEASPMRLIEGDEAANFQKIAAGQHSAALTQKVNEEMARAKQIQSAFQGQDTDPNAPASVQIFKNAARMTQLGHPQEAAKMLAEGTLAASREAMTGAHQAQGLLTRARAFDELEQAQARNYQGVKSQQEFDLANAVWEQQTGKPSPYAGLQWSPQLMDHITSKGLSAKDNALMEYERGKAKEGVAAEQSLTELRKARAEAARAQAALSETRGKHLEKTGGPGAKDIGMPTKEAFNMAARAIFADYPDISDQDARRLADIVANEALAIRKGQPGLDQATAMKRALDAHRTEIQVLEVPEKGLFPAAKRAVGMGGTKRQQAYRPTTADGAADVPEVARKGMAYQNGKRYRLPDGRVGVRKDGGFEIVGE